MGIKEWEVLNMELQTTCTIISKYTVLFLQASLLFYLKYKNATLYTNISYEIPS